MVHDDRHPFIGSDPHERVWHENLGGRLLRGCQLHSREIKANQQAAACRYRKLQKIATFHPRTRLSSAHRAPSFAAISAARWIALRMRGYVPQRQILPDIA